MGTLRGTLGRDTVANLLQYLALSRASGRLTIVHQRTYQGTIHLEGGLVVSVEAKPLRGVGALAAILAWDEGSFAFTRGEGLTVRMMREEVGHLLMKAAAFSGDTFGEFGAVPLSRDAVLAPLAKGGEDEGDERAGSGTFPHGSEELLLTLEALHLWRRLDGVSSLQQLSRRITRPTEVLVQAANELLEAGLADFVSLVVADARFGFELKREAVDLLGPVGEIVIEDAFLELGLSSESLPVSAVPELMRELANGVPARVRDEFMRRAVQLLELFALNQSGPTPSPTTPEPTAAPIVEREGTVDWEGVRDSWQKLEEA